MANYSQLAKGKKIVIIDEAQAIPEIGKILKLMIDNIPQKIPLGLRGATCCPTWTLFESIPSGISVYFYNNCLKIILLGFRFGTDCLTNDK